MSAFKFKLILFNFLLLLCLLTPKPIFATWTKSPQNPIFSPSVPWEGQVVKSPTLISNEEEYKMWYAGNNDGGWRIGYASSKNGINDWEKPVNSSIIDIKDELIEGWQEKDVHEPFVLYDQTEGYQMWYTSVGTNWQGGPDRFRLRYASSEDGIDWNEKDWVLRGWEGIPYEWDKWDSGGPYRGHSIIKTEDGYQMWYAGTGWDWQWKIGYAISVDGINWEKQNSGNAVIKPTALWEKPWESSDVCFPNVIFENGIYEMWYATGPTSLPLPIKIVYATSTDGIHWDKPADKNPVLVLGPSGSFDSVYISSPFVIKEGNTYKMWYSGRDENKKWQIGYAEEQIPTPAPSPTPPPLQPVVLLPGLGASWNHKAMILGVDQPQSEWYMTPGVKVYDGLIQTFQNAGYEKGANLFVFNYDWRQPVEKISNELKNYINNMFSPLEEIDLVGHSLGGLVARTYVQNTLANPVDQLITLGSPHQGVTKAYYIWEGGDLNRALSAWQKIGAGLLLHLSQPGFSTTMETVRSVIPSLKNLLPTFNYLKQNSEERPVGEMNEKNEWLMNLNISPPNHLFSVLNTFSGSIPNSTLKWIKVENPGWLDKVFGLWSDGKPIDEEEHNSGDKTVLNESAQFGNNITNLEHFDHRDLVETTTGQEEIMSILGLIPTFVSTISAEIFYEPSLVFQLASPAILSVFDSEGKSAGFGDDKMIVIPNANTEEYQAKITGTKKGEYHLHIGQIVSGKNIWTTTSGTIKPDDEIIYLINFNSDSPSSNPFVGQTSKDYQASARAKLITLKNDIRSKNISRSVQRSSLSQINRIIRYLDRKNFEKSIIYLHRFRQQLNYWQTRKQLAEVHNCEIKNKITEIISDLELAYLYSKPGSYSQSRLTRELFLAEKYFNRMKKQIKNLANQGKAKPNHGALFSLAEEKLNLAKDSSNYEAHINALGAKYLSLEGIRFIK